MRLPTQIPPLSGRGLAIFRVVWLVGFVVALIGATWGVAAALKQNYDFNRASYRIGLISPEIDGVRTVSPLFTEADPASFTPGSTIVAIDGKPWPTEASSAEADAFTGAVGGPEGTVHRLLLRDPQGKRHAVALTVSQANLDAFDARSPLPLAARMQLYAFNQWVIAALSLLAALVLFVKRAREPVVALLAIGFLIQYWQLAIALVDGPASDLLARLGPSNLIIGTAFALFPSGKFQPRWTVFVILGLVFLTFLPLLTTGPALAVLAIACAIGIVAANVVRYRRMSSQIERQQIAWGTFGIAAGMVLFAIHAALGLVHSGSAEMSLKLTVAIVQSILQIVAFAAMVGGLLVSLLRYRLYDADTVLSRSAVYGVLALAMIAVFAGTEKLVEILAAEYWGGSLGAAAGAIAAGLAATVIPLFHSRLQRWAERRFQGPLLALRDTLPDDLRDWRQAGNPSLVATDALARITTALRSRGGAIVARGAAQPVLAARDISEDDLAEWLAAFTAAELDRDDALLPLRIALGPLPGGGDGFLLLGPRPDGTAPGKDEREAAASIADPLGRALSVAQRREASDRAVHTALKSLGQRIAALEAEPKPA